ncbi:hypothetical protein NKH77_51260 [Streptomyces sp. M19]
MRRAAGALSRYLIRVSPRPTPSYYRPGPPHRVRRSSGGTPGHAAP